MIKPLTALDIDKILDNLKPTKLNKNNMIISSEDVQKLKNYTKDVKDIIYKPNLYDAEAFKYDFLYISYKGKMKETTDKKLGFISYGEDHVIYGHEILYFMRGVKKYSSFDTSEIMAKIYAKLVWLKANHPEIYQSRMGENFDLDKFMSEN